MKNSPYLTNPVKHWCAVQGSNLWPLPCQDGSFSLDSQKEFTIKEGGAL